MPNYPAAKFDISYLIAWAYIHCRVNNRRDWCQSTIFQAITLHSPCAFSQPQFVGSSGSESTSTWSVPTLKIVKWTWILLRKYILYVYV